MTSWQMQSLLTYRVCMRTKNQIVCENQNWRTSGKNHMNNKVEWNQLCMIKYNCLVGALIQMQHI